MTVFFSLRAELNNPGSLPDIDNTNQSSTLPSHAPYKTFHIRASVQPRRAKNIETSPSEKDRLFSKGPILPTFLLLPRVRHPFARLLHTAEERNVATLE